MSPELAAWYMALEALADPVTPVPAAAPAKARTGAAWRRRLDPMHFLRRLSLFLPA